MQPLWAPGEAGVAAWGLVHKYLLPYLVYLLLGAHILGALKHQFMDRHLAGLRRMVG